MSFGFSVGDFVAAAQLISSIVSSLRSAGGASSSFQELIRELDLLQRALTDIEHLSGPSSQQPCINAIKCAALNCHYVLDEFAGKLRKYEKSLGDGMNGLRIGGVGSSPQLTNSPSNGSTIESVGASSDKYLARFKSTSSFIKAGGKPSNWLLKARWELFMKEDVRDLRAYLVSHVGSLNLRMVTVGLSSASLAAKQADENRTALEVKLEELRQGIRDEFKSQQLVLQSNKTLLEKVIDIVNGEIVPQLKEHGNANTKVLDIVKNLQTRIPDPDIRFTWFQEPCRLEDARGHRLPIPSEFSSKLVRAIIHEIFRTGPGRRHVLAGDYQLSNVKNSNHLILDSSENGLIPGMNIRMAIILNKLHNSGECCPMPQCGSTTLIEALGGGKTCSECGVWFSEAKKTEKRKVVQEVVESSNRNQPRTTEFRRSGVVSRSSIEEDEASEDEREEMAHIKNIRLPEPPSQQEVYWTAIRAMQKRFENLSVLQVWISIPAHETFFAKCKDTNYVRNPHLVFRQIYLDGRWMLRNHEVVPGEGLSILTKDGCPVLCHDEGIKYNCHFYPCTYQADLEIHCKKHMEEAHSWQYMSAPRSNGVEEGALNASELSLLHKEDYPSTWRCSSCGSQLGDGSGCELCGSGLGKVRNDPGSGDENLGLPGGDSIERKQSFEKDWKQYGMTTSPPAFGTRYVRALYDYEADSRYNLSFHAGQLIQVITELENGWWDGVIDGVRGWFPSNYCEMSPDLDDAMERDQNGNLEMEEDTDEEEEEEEYYEDEYEDDESDSEDDDLSELQVGKSSYSDRTRADFWIPQASPDGGLFYFNTVTGESSMALPQENSETEHEDTSPSLITTSMGSTSTFRPGEPELEAVAGWKEGPVVFDLGKDNDPRDSTQSATLETNNVEQEQAKDDVGFNVPQIKEDYSTSSPRRSRVLSSANEKSSAIEAKARKLVNTIPVDFAARREAIRRAYSKSIVESENLKRLQERHAK